MNRLFEESSINTMPLKNRFVRAATWEGLATAKGEATPELIAMMASLAKGGVGLIVTSHAYVSQEGQGTPWQLGVYDDKLIAKLEAMASAVHQHNGRIIMQLAHAGLYAEVEITGQPALALSDLDGFPQENVRTITSGDIQRLVASFAQAAKRAKVAGFDGIEIHSGHGYLLSQFLSPACNKRQDEYGGAIENRARIHLRMYKAIREVVGPDYPLLIKMNCADFIDNGLTREDSLQAARLFAAAGFDAIEVSGGIIRTGRLSPSRPGITTEDQEAYFKEYAEDFKRNIQTPLILVGGLRSFTVADRIVAERIADYIAMSRPFIREPDLINRWKNGDLGKAECTSDNLCFNPGFKGHGVYCVTKERENSH
ncbi:NADH:flavin oxidoreductase [Desulfoprunum benzoelyticum]|uniref:2,4-dienoyl-CoA reductase-like NADH-dependent reductase (Old Yellow Enzyme family) n=1 Tax=Desulfoprunum benzoelyticum TaxID=1506996 RepID=A0A840UQ14_9BACT|nr:NADH:flavin oxidoreductase [Desulfoprunum benzoelyticum]MBB5346663.1 2,4-dienoyl-CoA reductase-like NADH-dependent reductase (Old Yellow Enzyme family) [Desulfoprunum benzoelyticum]MBM9529092.1 NADH:flavin oxidoreductase [Desulfoprunum benzoelyticum]